MGLRRWTRVSVVSRDFALLSKFEFREARKKEQLKKDLEDRKTVRGYEEAKAKGTLRLTDEAADRESKLSTNYALDDLWAKVRNFLNDINEKGEKRVMGRVDKPNRLKFREACESRDFSKKGVLSEQQMENVFSEIRFLPLPSRDELRMLYRALEVYAGIEN